MNISTRGRYGLRALADMTLHAVNGPVALRVIAERQNLSESYLEQVFSSLRKAGIVRSVRGAQGGYELNRPANEISVGEILRVLEGPLSPVQCVDGSYPGVECEMEKTCLSRPFWEELNNVINRFLDETTLQDIIDKAPRESQEQPMFYI